MSLLQSEPVGEDPASGTRVTRWGGTVEVARIRREGRWQSLDPGDGAPPPLRRGLTVAVCTYLRPGSVSRLLDALADQTGAFDDLVVVDASPDSRTQAAVLDHRLWDRGHGGVYVRVSGPGRGLPRQRNLALDVVATDLVAFLDDDVVPLPDCLETMVSTLRHDDGLVGVGAQLLPAPGSPAPSNRGARMRLRRVLRIVPGLEPGRYYRTGMSTVWDPAGQSDPVTPGDWLPGYAAVWRTAIARAERYADDFAGYAQGEDLEFSLRAGRHGGMAVAWGAVVRDHHDPGGRPRDFARGRMAVRNRYEIHRRALPDRRVRDVLAFVYAWSLDTVLLLTGLLRPRTARQTVAHVVGRAVGAAGLLGRSVMRRGPAASLDPRTTSLCVVAGTNLWQLEPAGSGEAEGWAASGGFPLQIQGMAGEFASVHVVGPTVGWLEGGTRLPSTVSVSVVPKPPGGGAWGKLGFVLTLPRHLPAVVRAVRRHDAVYVPLPGDLPLMGLFVALMMRKAIVTRWCSAWEDNAHTTRSNRLVKRLLRLLARGPGRVVVLATGMGEVEPAPGIAWLASSALPSAELAGDPPDLDRGLGDPVRIAFAGRLAPEKGVGSLLAAVARLRQAGRRVELVVMGDGPLRGELEATATRLGLDGAVEFTGRLDRAQLNRRFREADLAVQPSTSEAFAKAWLDALANGVPVIATSAGGMAELFLAANGVGWVVPPSDDDALADAITAALDGVEDWSELRSRCRATVEGHTLEAWAGRFAAHSRSGWGAS